MRDILVPILQCPKTKESLYLKDEELVNDSSTCHWPLIKGCPCFLENQAGVQESTCHSPVLPPRAKEIIGDTNGIVLNLSAGNPPECYNNVVEVEICVGQTTDVIADAHDLPFKNDSFDAIICLNAFEHYKNPSKVALEIRRTLKKGGLLYVHTANLQPLHMEPSHYYNMTVYGMSRLFEDFKNVELGVPDCGNPLAMLSWLANDTYFYLNESLWWKDSVKQFENMTIGELRDLWNKQSFWDHPLYREFNLLPKERLLRIASVLSCEAINDK